MDSFIEHFHFLRPFWLVALLPMCLILFALWRRKQQSAGWQKHIAPQFLAVLSEGKFSKAQFLPLVLWAIIWSLCILALAGPTWTQKPEKVHQQQSALVVLWDLSPSMLAEDISPSRLVRSRLKLTDILNQRLTGLTSLIVYSGEAHMVTPLTDDTRTIKALLPSLSPTMMPTRGSNIEHAFELAINTLSDAGQANANIIIITDGIAQSALEQLETLNQGQQHRIAIMSIGTSEGAPIPLNSGSFARNAIGDIVIAQVDDAALSEAANALGGIYAPFSQSDLDIQTALNFGIQLGGNQPLNSTNKNASDNNERFFDNWIEYGPYLLFPVVLIFALSFRRGWILPIIMLGVVMQPRPSLAQTANAEEDLASLVAQDKNNNTTGASTPSERWWLSDNLNAQRALNNNQADTAAELFQDKDWKAAAQYKAGNYAAAAEHFAKGDSSNDALNHGNSLAKQGQYEAASKAYATALERDENNKAAFQNKAVVDTIIENRKKNDPQQNQDGEQGQQGEQSDQQDGQQQNGEQQNGEQQNGQQQQGQQQDGQQQNNQAQNSQEQSGQQGAEQDQNDQNQQGSADEQARTEAEEQASAEDKAQQQQDLEDHFGEQQDAEKQAQAQPTQQPDQADEQEGHAQAQADEQADAENSEQTPAAQQQMTDASQAQTDEASDNTQTANMQVQRDQQLSEEEQALEQWLRKVPDDPGGLLRNKFKQQYNQNRRQRQPSVRQAPDEEQRW